MAGTIRYNRRARCPVRIPEEVKATVRYPIGGLLLSFFLISSAFGSPPGQAPVSDRFPSTGQAPAAVPLVFEARRLDEPPRIDGVLDEPFWEQITPLTGFRQRTPVDGAPASEPTEVRVAYDDNNLYFGFMLYDSDPSAIRRSILHREGRIDQDDRVIIALDTYNDNRNGYIFELNALGTQGDAWFNDESLEGSDWNWEGIYESAARVEEWGWALEVAIPTTTIRFREAEEVEMGVAFYRAIRRKNEDVFLPHISQDYRGGIYQVSQYATLQGLRGLRRGNDLEIKPWGLLGGESVAAPVETDFVADAGLDVKWGITTNLTADITVNTDFAQVEADNVQINLTRFGLFFPEKREFFLERAGLFQFGNPRETEVFFSRRIGIDNEIIGGGRVTGQQGPWSIGILDLQTQNARSEDEDETDEGRGANNFVGRVRRDLGRRGSVGAIFTNLQNDTLGDRVAGVDFEQRFLASSSVRGWFAKEWDAERDGGGVGAGHAELQLSTNRYSAGVSYTDIGAGFDPAIGFVRRDDMVRWGANAGFRPRFEGSGWARELSVTVGGNEVAGQDGVLQSQLQDLNASFTFESGDRIIGGFNRNFERLFEPFPIRDDVTLAAGDYRFSDASIGLRTNESRWLSGRVQLELGDFWSGTIRVAGGEIVWKQSEHLSLAFGGDHRDVSLPLANGDFSTTILTHRIALAASRDLFANALIQYDSDSRTVQANVRLDWIHTPGSDLFLVFDTGYRTGFVDPRDSRWTHRTGVAKLTYLRAF